MSRIETGRTQFEGDWPGIFLRGDNALFYGNTLEAVIAALHNVPDLDSHVQLNLMLLDGLKDLLKSCAQSETNVPTALLKSYNECLAEGIDEDETPVAPA